MWLRIKIKLIYLICILLFYYTPVQAARLYTEKTYQQYWCNKYGGITEVKLPDDTRVDCVLVDYAIEFDFANKWSEAIGQSLYYGHCMNKKAGVVLILEDAEKDVRYLKRLMTVANLHNITVWTITPSDLKCSENY